jgi:hypothetical protein
MKDLEQLARVRTAQQHPSDANPVQSLLLPPRHTLAAAHTLQRNSQQQLAVPT